MTRQISSSQDFDQFLASHNVALVDFTATWCPPCQILKPVINKVAEGHDGVAMVDIDSNADLATRYGVSAVPTMIFFRDGKPVDQLVGAAPQALIEKRLAALSA